MQVDGPQEGSSGSHTDTVAPELQHARQLLRAGMEVCSRVCGAVEQHDGSGGAHDTLVQDVREFTQLLEDMRQAVGPLQAFRLPLELVRSVDEDKNPEEFFQKVKEKSELERDALLGKRDAVDLLRQTIVQHGQGQGLLMTPQEVEMATGSMGGTPASMGAAAGVRSKSPPGPP